MLVRLATRPGKCIQWSMDSMIGYTVGVYEVSFIPCYPNYVGVKESHTAQKKEGVDQNKSHSHLSQ